MGKVNAEMLHSIMIAVCHNLWEPTVSLGTLHVYQIQMSHANVSVHVEQFVKLNTGEGGGGQKGSETIKLSNPLLVRAEHFHLPFPL